MVIFKYPVSPGEFSVLMPAKSNVVAVQAQHDVPQMWAVVDPDSPKVSLRFRTVATGEPFGNEWNYVGTFQLHGGVLVWHLLEAA
jgi:hypothetical protein